MLPLTAFAVATHGFERCALQARSLLYMPITRAVEATGGVLARI